MALTLALILVAGGSYAIFKLLWRGRMTGDKRMNAVALVIALVMLFGVKGLLSDSEPKKVPQTAKTATTNINVPTLKTESEPSATTPPANTSDAQLKNRIKKYLESLPGMMIVIVRGDSTGIIVECDYNMGNVDKATAQSYATELINGIMIDNGDCNFKYISLNCMNGKSPIGVIVNYEDGNFYTIP